MLGTEVTFNWTTHCENTLKLLKSELVRIPALQYPNPNKQFKLFTDASKHSYSGVLHQEETSDMPGIEVSLIPIVSLQVLLVELNSCGTQLRRRFMQSTVQFKNLHFILQEPIVHYIVLISHWHYSSLQVCPVPC